jgi:hypothetical protein
MTDGSLFVTIGLPGHMKKRKIHRFPKFSFSTVVEGGSVWVGCCVALKAYCYIQGCYNAKIRQQRKPKGNGGTARLFVSSWHRPAWCVLRCCTHHTGGSIGDWFAGGTIGDGPVRHMPTNMYFLISTSIDGWCLLHFATHVAFRWIDYAVQRSNENRLLSLMDG